MPLSLQKFPKENIIQAKKSKGKQKDRVILIVKKSAKSKHYKVGL